MATQASNGKELLLVMRAGVGVFPAGEETGKQVRSIVADKMIRSGTLEQLIELARVYSVNAEDARRVALRIFELAGENSNPGVWNRIRWAANHLQLRDLEQQAQAKGDQLSHGKTSANNN